MEMYPMIFYVFNVDKLEFGYYRFLLCSYENTVTLVTTKIIVIFHTPISKQLVFVSPSAFLPRNTFVITGKLWQKKYL